MLTQALSELKAEVLNGAAVADVVAEIAADNGVHPALLARKFAESYTSEEAVRATAAATDPEKNLATRITRKVAEVCKYYGVPVDAVKQVQWRGKTYTAICRDRNARVRQVVAVSHEDGLAYRLAA